MRSGHGQRAARSIGMICQPVRSSHMSELPMVVTARLHVTRGCGVTKVCPGTRTAGCRHLVATRTEARFTVTFPDALQLCVEEKANQAPPDRRGYSDYPTAGHRHRQRQGQARGRPAAGLDPGSTRPTTQLTTDSIGEHVDVHFIAPRIRAWRPGPPRPSRTQHLTAPHSNRYAVRNGFHEGVAVIMRCRSVGPFGAATAPGAARCWTG
jgi:hypothetical protein